jgi:chromosome segregation ATPase
MYCKGCGIEHEEGDDRLCPNCDKSKAARAELPTREWLEQMAAAEDAAGSVSVGGLYAELAATKRDLAEVKRERDAYQASVRGTMAVQDILQSQLKTARYQYEEQVRDKNRIATEYETQLATTTAEAAAMRECLAEMVLVASNSAHGGPMQGIRDGYTRLQWYGKLIPIRESAKTLLESTTAGRALLDEVEGLRKANTELQKHLIAITDKVANLSADKAVLECQLTTAKATIAELREALSDLCDWQNGPPLVTYEEGWTAAMKKARELLSTAPPASEGSKALGGGR